MNKIFFLGILSIQLFSQELITPIPLENNYHINKAKLGKKLFYDTRLSQDNTISCASCHIIEEGGDDNIPISLGVNGSVGIRNSPTVLNSKFNFTQFWDGRSNNLEEQVSEPIHNPVEMNSNFAEIIQKLQQDTEYPMLFNTLYKDGITDKNIANAIAEYENSLTTPNSRFDQFLRGNTNALTKDEKKGYTLFKEYGCISCHNGVNVGGNLMQKIGILEDFISSDLGRYHITQKEEDKHYFKVPSLRNIALTSPYFHNGLTPTLKDAVIQMAYYQVGYHLSNQEVNYITKFLLTLTGELNYE